MDLARTWQLLRKNWRPWPEGKAGLSVRDHRQMDGGAWDEIGPLQFELLKREGLRPDHVLLDIGCGSFRAGRLLIDYLEPGHYLAIDKQAELVEAGREREVDPAVWEAKQPEVVITDRFEFEKLSKAPDFAIAQSLFTHLTANDIALCFTELAKVAQPHCVCYATYFLAERPVAHLLGSHSSRRFEYTEDQMRSFGASSGWSMRYIGDWGHPRGQVLAVYSRAGG